MSPNNPYEPGEGSDSDNVPPPHEPRANQNDPLANNPYSTQYRESAAPDLDAGAPQLRSNEMRRMNQRALFMLGAVVLLLLFVAYWLIKSAGSHNDQPKQREEKVTVAEAPHPIALPPPPLPQTQVAPIPLATQPVPLPPAQLAKPAHTGPSLLDRRIANGDSGDSPAQAAPAPSTSSGQSSAGRMQGLSEVASAQPLTHPGTLMQRGTYIRCVLESRIISDIPGFATCLVTEPVYSFTGRQLLLPKGSKVLGSFDKPPPGRRVAIIWDRIITPTGIDVNMSSPGIDNLGSSGVPGYYNAHWASRVGAALLISILSDAFKYEGEKHGPTTTTITGNGLAVQQPFQSNTAETLQNLAGQATQASANRPPTITINQGTVIYVYVAKDIDFSGVVARF